MLRMSTSGIRLDDLFARNRCETGWDELSLVFYFPFGIFLVILRIIIGLLLCVIAYILPRLSAARCVTLRILYAILGFVIKEEGAHFRDSRAEFLIANHVTVFDHIAIDLIAPCVLSLSWELPEFFKNILGFKKIERRDDSSSVSGAEDGKNTILIFPEGATTNGHRGLLKFATWPFMSSRYLQPVTVRVYRPAGVNIAPSVIDSTWWSDLFWAFFVPFTTFEIRYLPIMIRRDNQTAEEFSVSVQTVMAQQLDIIPTSFTAHDKMEYAKRLLTSQSSPQRTNVLPRTSAASSSQSTSLSIMSQQVKEVLPYVPLNVIEQDLTLTDNVSLTITRILEGNVLYVPETEPNLLTCSLQPGTSNISGAVSSNYQLPSTASKTFGKTPKERMLSYQERKAQLMDSARRRYLQKHQPYSPATMF